MLNKYSGQEMTPAESLDVSRFAWNSKCSQDQIERMQSLRDAGKDMCELFISCVPKSADRGAAIRYLRLAIMQCNLAIAHEGIEVS